MKKINIVKEKRNDPVFLKKLTDIAIKEAKRQSYEVLLKWGGINGK